MPLCGHTCPYSLNYEIRRNEKKSWSENTEHRNTKQNKHSRHFFGEGKKNKKEKRKKNCALLVFWSLGIEMSCTQDNSTDPGALLSLY